MKKYENYKLSNIDWVGSIPLHWEIVKPKFKLNRVTRPVEVNDEVITCFRDGVVTLRKNRREDGFTNSIQEHGYQHIKKGDLVVHEMDGFAGAIGISDSEGKSTPVYTVIEPDNRTDLKYISYLLREMSQNGKIESLARSIRERTTDFRWNMWSTIHFPFPPLNEQRIISLYLDKKIKQIDSLIKKIEKKIELIHEQKTALINKYINKGITSNVELKDSGLDMIGEIPRNWRVSKFPWVCFFQEGPGLRNWQFVDDGIPVVCVTNITERGLDFNKLKRCISNEEYFNSYQHFKVEKNDLLLASSGNSFGKVCSYKGEFNFEFILNTSTIRLHTLNDQIIKTKFIKLLIESDVFQNQIKILITGAAQPNFGPSHLNQIRIPIPPLDEQELISEKFEKTSNQMELLLEKVIKKIEILQEYRQSLISSVVTGKIRITEDMI